MDFSKENVDFLAVLVFFLFMEKAIVLSCELPSGKISPCGDKFSCPKTCCQNGKTRPNCYFQNNAYGVIQHNNGLCMKLKDDSYQNNNHLIWSRDCTSKNAFFLVSNDHPIFHIASGMCILPNGRLSNPKDKALVLKSAHSNKDSCNAGTVSYRPTKNGNLEYFYLGRSLRVCIGSKSEGGPKENDRVYILEKACDGLNCSEAVSYVNQRMFSEGKNADLRCEPCSTIKIIWANFGVMHTNSYPYVISSSIKNCVTTTATSVVQGKCDGKTQCFFAVKDADFLQTNCRRRTFLLVRYTCRKGKMQGIRPPSGKLPKSSLDDKLAINTLKNVSKIKNEADDSQKVGNNSEDATTDSTKSDDQVSLYFFIAIVSSGVVVGINFLIILLVGCRRLINGKPSKTRQANPEPEAGVPGTTGATSALGGSHTPTSPRFSVETAVYDEPSNDKVGEIGRNSSYESVDAITLTRSGAGYELPHRSYIRQSEVRYENCLFNGYAELNQMRDQGNYYAGLKPN
ncbi:uncharacterized protein LOC114534554 [Dendronephthya gigantea]|uniref:uncharacterized protein LOC114534554 n=1 Tax=Dendronephthya gigantea TaxID=151771 RepID=UPI00106D20D2|nr:uncharacterized protein LOC114534554 [Dendronephthya gigantea]